MNRRRIPSLNALLAFEAAGRLGRMTRAGEELGVTHGAVSRQVAHLEGVLGVPLFEGPKNQLALTPAGHVLLADLTASFDRIEAGVRRLKEDRAGALDVSCLGTLFSEELPMEAPVIADRTPARAARASCCRRGTMNLLRFAAWLSAVCLIAVSHPAIAQVPMPPDLRIVPPGPEVPAEVAHFAGGWGNAGWGGVLPTALVVESVEASGAATVVYAIGTSEQLGMQPLWVRVPGQVADGRLTLRLRGGTVADYTPTAEGHLVGRYTAPQGWRSQAWLARVPGDAAQVAATVALPVRQAWEEVSIPMRSGVGEAAGRTLLLQAFLYRTELPGRQPLVVLNHGSTDSGRPGVPGIEPFEAQARFFLARGWNVVAFMRKGRGRSGGPMLEPSSRAIPEQDQLESGLEDLDAVAEHMRAQPYVDSARIVVAGQSRGGLLAVAYAGRHPREVAGVVNFSGGWWSESWDNEGFNLRQAALAGKGTKAPILWLYADRDPYYGLPYVRRLFQAFRDAGGQGELAEFTGLPGSGHALIGWTERWEPVAARFLDGIGHRGTD